jgi:hypothetical protein
MMNLSGAFGGAIAGTILGALQFGGLNFFALIPVSVITVLSFLNYKRAI